MGKRFEQAPHKRGDPNDHYKYEKMLNFFSNQGNSDYKYKEIIFHTWQVSNNFVNLSIPSVCTNKHHTQLLEM